MQRGALVAIVLALMVSSCASGKVVVGPERQPPPTSSTSLPVVDTLTDLTLETVAEGLEHPVSIAPAPGVGDTFIVERTGRVVTASSAGLRAVLDITAKVGWQISEQGFLGFAVHPEFPDDPRAWAVYTNLDEDVVVSEFTWNGERFDASSEHRILEVPQPHYYHQGGGITFGPRGYLWLSFGDGGGIGDPYHNGQDPSTLNGTVVRIDVDAGEPYAIPPDNPFVDGGQGRPEVWAFGFRNPWRVTVVDDVVLIADVGQEGAEEIDVVEATDGGHNFGWPIMEADDCFEAPTCDTAGLTEPTMVLSRDDMCALIGGPVYRGAAIPEMRDQYVFGDHCRGWMRSVKIEGTNLGAVTDWEPMLGPIGNITTFGIDEDGELLVATLDGVVSRVVPIRSTEHSSGES
jgi:glucose/arabinose dehydrogenase